MTGSFLAKLVGLTKVGLYLTEIIATESNIAISHCHDIALEYYTTTNKTSLYICTIRNYNSYGMKNFSINGFQ